MKRYHLLGLFAAYPISMAAAATARVELMFIRVTNSTDGGSGSLRPDGVIILDANAHANVSTPDMISFAIPGSGLQTITPSSPLPTITDAVVIDGYTQPGASANTLAVGDNAVLLIELNGTSASGSGLTLSGLNGGSTVRGLVINRFGSDFYDGGIFLDSGNNIVAGNFIGTDATGNSELGNFCGVRVATGANNLIGGTVPAARNILSGNNFQEGNVIIEPRFGSTAPTPSGTLIRGNYIGTNAAGTAAVHPQAFARAGVVVIVGAGTVIGGTDVGARNVISGNSDGIQTTETSLTLPVELTVQGNFIGVDVTGLTALPNAGYGIFFTPPRDRSDSSLTVGGTAAGAGNVISGNTANGLLLSNSNLVMQGNRIGTDLAGNLNLGNGNHGVELTRGGSPPFPRWSSSRSAVRHLPRAISFRAMAASDCDSLTQRAPQLCRATTSAPKPMARLPWGMAPMALRRRLLPLSAGRPPERAT